MCTGKCNNKEFMALSCLHFHNQKPKPKLQIHVKLRIQRLKRVNKFIEEKTKYEMEIRNLKLYMENMRILKENEGLKNKAKMLHQENLDLLLELEKKKAKI
ncbi:protein LITTLE ZIPPER 1-like [Bidens hawaiensis]|uniref:protein LITTLE ZIPPER 1-like n=1 Tax=Bidens hawaiensis TaxID=980011 RepID=UPI00404A50C6